MTVDPATEAHVCAPWATPEDVTKCGTRYDDLDPYVLDDALYDASDLLFLLSGQQYPGECEDVVRPSGRCYGTRNAPAWHGAPPEAEVDVSGWWSWDESWGLCECQRPTTGSCGCRGPSKIRLGAYPIVEVTEVLVDGEALDPAAYDVADGLWLVRLPDLDDDETSRSWPCCQRLDLPATEAGTFEVSFVYGAAPPGMGRRAAAKVAGELALDRCGGECELGPGVRSFRSEGVDVNVVDQSAPIRDQLPQSARLFLDAENPKDLRRSATVWSPDLGVSGTRFDG